MSPSPALATVPIHLDPDNHKGRLYKQVTALLTKLETQEHTTIREITQALLAIGRLEEMFVKMRKSTPDESDRTGTVVRKYASAFSAADGSGRPGRDARPARAAESEPADDWFERAGDADSDEDTDSDDEPA